MSNPLWDNLLLREGEDYNNQWIIDDANGNPIDFSVGGYSAAMMVRQDNGDPAPAMSFTSSPANGIALGADGTCTLTIPRASIAGLVNSGWNQRPRGIFSILLTDPSGNKTTEVEGTVFLKRLPTR